MIEAHVKLKAMPASSSNPAAQRAIEAIQESSASGTVLCTDGLRQLDTVVEVGKAMLRSAFRELVDLAEWGPILTSKSCDGTLLNIVNRKN